MYDMTIVLLKWNGQMLMSNSQSSSGDVVHVSMSSFSETADAEKHHESRTHQCVCGNQNRASVPFTYTETRRTCRIHI